MRVARLIPGEDSPAKPAEQVQKAATPPAPAAIESSSPSQAVPSAGSRGRRKSTENLRSAQIGVHCTPEEKIQIIEAARAAGRSPGRYLIRMALMKRAAISSEHQLYDDIMRDRDTNRGADKEIQPEAAQEGIL